MTASITASNTTSETSPQDTTKLNQYIQENGRFPPVSLSVTSISTGNSISINQFTDYYFSSSVLIPVDTFSVSLVLPNEFGDTSKVIRGGDIAYLKANGVSVSCGLINVYNSNVSANSSKKIMVTGRDLMSQLEDNDAVSLASEIIYGSNISVSSAINKLIENTRANGFEIRGIKDDLQLLATSPGESKLSVLQRLLDPLNAIAWCDGNGKIIVGKPNFTQKSSGKIFVNRNESDSNVLSMSVTRDATRIANVVVPVWSGLEGVVGNLPVFTPYYNKAAEPSRLYAYNHRVIRTLVQSVPSGTSSGDLAQINVLLNNANNLMQNYANRFFARENIKELIIECVVAGHYNDDLKPYVVDTVYNITHDTEGINGVDMYLFEVQYTLDTESGQRTKLRFCNLNTICSGGETK